MQPRALVYDGHQPQQSFSEGAEDDSRHWVPNAHLGTDELSDRREWLLLLGISASFADDLASLTMQQPLFSLAYFQQHWEKLRLVFGPKRENEADVIVLREIRELLATTTPQADRLNWSSYQSRLSDKSLLENCGGSPIYSPNVYNPDQRRTSTPVNQLEPVAYNIDADSLNVGYYQQSHQQTYNCNYNNTNSTSNYQNSYNVIEGPCYTNDDIEQIAFNHPTGLNYAYPNPNFNNIYWTANYQQDLQSNNFYFNEKANELKMQNANNLQFQTAINTGTDISDWKTYGNQHNNDLQDESSLDKCLSSNMRRTPREQTQRRHRKRSAGRQNSTGKDLIDRKRRCVEVQKDVFKIGDFMMPKVVINTDRLPQPEEDSHAIRFFRMKHCFIVGGKTAAKSGVQARAQLSFPNYNRSIAKRIRLALRDDWTTMYRKMNYKNWYNWWNGFKWCGEDIDTQLLRFRGIDLENNSFLYSKLTYDTRQEVNQVLHMARIALQLNKTNYQSVLCTIFELMNMNFLKALYPEDFGKMQDMIRHMPNHLWLYKMRSMVYLWSRYSRIQNNSENAAAHVHSKELIATKSQWNSALFHWLAKQAFDEVKRISSREWPDHEKTFSQRK